MAASIPCHQNPAVSFRRLDGAHRASEYFVVVGLAIKVWRAFKHHADLRPQAAQFFRGVVSQPQFQIDAAGRLLNRTAKGNFVGKNSASG